MGVRYDIRGVEGALLPQDPPGSAREPEIADDGEHPSDAFAQLFIARDDGAGCGWRPDAAGRQLCGGEQVRAGGHHRVVGSNRRLRVERLVEMCETAGRIHHATPNWQANENVLEAIVATTRQCVSVDRSPATLENCQPVADTVENVMRSVGEPNPDDESDCTFTTRLVPAAAVTWSAA